MRAVAYVDGFNLYYGALRKHPSCKWLDLAAMLRLLLPDLSIERIRYFTAHVNARPEDPDAPTRQQKYIRALKTTQNLTVHLGHFLVHRVKMPLAESTAVPPERVYVTRTEEKGSDVALASWMLLDAFEDKFEIAVVVSNDSDLLPPVRMVREKFGKKVLIVCPHEHPSKALLKHSDGTWRVRRGLLEASQFPDAMRDQHGPLERPQAWKAGGSS
jgi:uncharacterized LabA/DUF88 family protein